MLHFKHNTTQHNPRQGSHCSGGGVGYEGGVKVKVKVDMVKSRILWGFMVMRSPMRYMYIYMEQELFHSAVYIYTDHGHHLRQGLVSTLFL